MRQFDVPYPVWIEISNSSNGNSSSSNSSSSNNSNSSNSNSNSSSNSSSSDSNSNSNSNRNKRIGNNCPTGVTSVHRARNLKRILRLIYRQESREDRHPIPGVSAFKLPD
ncbi:hypothetical protein HZH66_011191 [Vespula vulgaris]|uniref:Uncharacterized protein n=1 Tax=Vespula vulgaris TaxID=7454 RepID=A0A834JE61_VESVU|nr:hypothetical protein HZH66_011191 [Vespula vulgaris]